MVKHAKLCIPCCHWHSEVEEEETISVISTDNYCEDMNYYVHIPTHAHTHTPILTQTGKQEELKEIHRVSDNFLQAMLQCWSFFLVSTQLSVYCIEVRHAKCTVKQIARGNLQYTTTIYSRGSGIQIVQ